MSRKVLLLPRPTFTSLSVTLQTMYEDHYSDVYIPTTEPGTPQHQWTVASGDLPTFSRKVTQVQYVAFMVAAGHNDDASSRTISWRMLKNSGSVNSGSFGVAAGYAWTVTACFANVSVSDVLEIAVWTDAASVVTIDYDGHQIAPENYLLPELDNQTALMYVHWVGDKVPNPVGGHEPGGLWYSGGINFTVFSGTPVKEDWIMSYVGDSYDGFYAPFTGADGLTNSGGASETAGTRVSATQHPSVQGGAYLKLIEFRNCGALK